MPRNIPAGLAGKLDNAATSLAELIQVVPRFGSTLRFAAWHSDVVLGGESEASIQGTYLARPGMMVKRAESNMRLEVDNSEAFGRFYSGVVTFSDLAAGRFDHATFKRVVVDPEDVGSGSYVFQSGLIGSVRVIDNIFQAELRSLSQLLQQGVGKIVSKGCDVTRVGDARCKFDMTATQAGTGFKYRSTWTVASQVSDMTFTATLNGGQGSVPDSGWFDSGYLEFTSGANAGIPMEVFQYGNAAGTQTFQMLDRVPYALAGGVTFQVDAGCDRSFDMCQTKFVNRLNFRGFPDLVGDDMYEPADARL